MTALLKPPFVRGGFFLYYSSPVKVGYPPAKPLREAKSLDLPAKQKKMILGWAVLRHDELMENWKLAEQKKELFQIDPVR